MNTNLLSVVCLFTIYLFVCLFFSIFNKILTKFLKYPSFYLWFIVFEYFKINNFSHSHKNIVICSAKTIKKVYFPFISLSYIQLITVTYDFQLWIISILPTRMKNYFNVIFHNCSRKKRNFCSQGFPWSFFKKSVCAYLLLISSF